MSKELGALIFVDDKKNDKVTFVGYTNSGVTISKEKVTLSQNIKIKVSSAEIIEDPEIIEGDKFYYFISSDPDDMLALIKVRGESFAFTTEDLSFDLTLDNETYKIDEEEINKVTKLYSNIAKILADQKDSEK